MKNYSKMCLDSTLKYGIYIAVFFFIFNDINAQNTSGDTGIKGSQDFRADDKFEEIKNLLELLAEENEEIVNNDTYFEQLIDFYDNKIHINKSDDEDFLKLSQMGLITEIQVNNLLDYGENVGEIINKYELQAIPGWDLVTIKKALPFLKVTGDLKDYNVPFKKLIFEGKNELFLRVQRVLEDQAGYLPIAGNPDSTKYAGSQEKLYMRYRHKYGSKISFGFTAEKDPGEEFFRGSQKQGFDFYSAHFFMRDVGPFKSIALGDYHIKLGQGLIGWTNLGFGKSPEVVSVKRQGNTIEPFTSVNEYLFLRGAAATLETSKKTELTLFGSYKNVDNNIEVDSLDDLGLEIIKSGNIQEGGFHRTASEIRNRKQNTQTNAGGDFTYKTRRFKLGVSSLYTGFEKSINLNNGDTPYKLHQFSGDKLLNASVHYRFLYGNVNLFGEMAISDDLNGKRGYATLNGAIMSLHQSIDLSVVYRNFQAEYQTILADPFMESSTPINERGIFMGVQIKPFKNWRLNAYTDYYKHDWLRFGVDAPSMGNENLVQLEYRPSKKLTITGRFDSKSEGRNLDRNSEDILQNDWDLVRMTKRNRFRIELKYKLTDDVSLKSRLMTVKFDDGVSPTERGYMIFQDISYNPKSLPVSFNSRYGLFDVATADSRVYTYENDLLYVFAITSFSGVGRRFYFNIRYNITRNISFWAKYSRTTFDNSTVIRSGNNLIIGNKVSEIKAQLRFKF